MGIFIDIDWKIKKNKFTFFIEISNFENQREMELPYFKNHFNFLGLI